MIMKDGIAIIKFIRKWSIGCDLEKDNEESIKEHLKKHIPEAEFVSVEFKEVKRAPAEVGPCHICKNYMPESEIEICELCDNWVCPACSVVREGELLCAVCSNIEK